eukprot:5092623-Amphidinium_carterae.1
MVPSSNYAEDGQQHGTGTYKSATGETRTGEWEEGRRTRWSEDVHESVSASSQREPKQNMAIQKSSGFAKTLRNACVQLLLQNQAL